MAIDTEEARTLLVDEQARLQQIRTSLTLEPVDSLGEREALSELSLADQHPADVATETFEREKDVSILEQLEEELAELQAALERIDNGTYGVDEVTGKPIAPERLEARPTARTNVDTEGQREADGRLPRGGAGDPEEY
jgi:RNA polymerase-binding transcription factor DksA